MEGHIGHVATEVTKDVGALLREGDLVDSVVQQVHHIQANESTGDGNLEPHAATDLQHRFRGCHGFDDGGHVTVDGQV